MAIHILSILLEAEAEPPREIVWNRKYDEKFSNLLITNNRLSDVLSKISYKAAMAIASVLTELVQQWSSKKYFPHIDIVKEFPQKINSLWTGAIDPLYLKTFRFDWEYFDENGDTVTYTANWYIVRHLTKEYTESSFTIHRYLINLSMLARHLTPNKKLFDQWFTETMRKTAEVFPCTYDYADLDFNDKEARYDCSVDAPVPREFFFDPEFEYSEETAKPVLNAFLQSLDYNNNPWLCTPEEMLGKGFKGTPYEV
ncbi:MAG: hypothetical protein FWG14_14215 [Peptococcaceae bacterium]|nr:hypothetical protein [Peptococcaceae bacterium]